MNEVNKYNHTPRRVFEKAIDRLEDKIVRINEKQKRHHRRLREIEEFLGQSPHAAAWVAYQQLKDFKPEG